MKYAVAVLSFFENENRVFVIEAKNEVEAMVKALSSKDKMLELEEDYVKWIDEMLLKTVEEIQEECFNGDIAISKPVLVN